MVLNYADFTQTPVNSIQELIWAVLYPQWQGSQKKVSDNKSMSGGKADPNKSSSGADVNPSGPPAPIPFNTSEIPRLFALIIGINDYESPTITNLKGAVPDSNAFQEFLEKTLNVPNSQIRILRNKQATRSAIVEAFKSLRSDPLIEKGDAIVIFYAGHGSETKAPAGWEAGGDKIQMLVPYDCNSTLDGRVVHGIPDRSLGALISNLAKVKGDNITVVFDCCHSGSSTRASSTDLTCMSRTAKVPDNVPTHLDQDLWSTSASGERGAEIPTGFLHKGLRSHMLLAACNEKETAKEENGRGLFTQALLSAITVAGADKLTYYDLFQRIPSLPQQNPQCEGVNASRILFNAKASSPRRVFYKVEHDGSKYTLSAGAVHGISKGAEFTVYKDKSSPPTAPPLGVLVVRESKAFTSDMDIAEKSQSFSLPEPGFGLQTKAGAEEHLRLHITQDKKLTDVLIALDEEMQAPESDRRRISLVEKDKAEFSISVENDRVIFHILNPLVVRFGLTRMPHTVPPHVDNVYPVIRAAAHFQWHLRRANFAGSLQKDVKLEVVALKSIEDDDGDEEFVVDGENLNHDGIVDVVGGDTLYGFKITNNSAKFDLYPALFYFDNSDFSVDPFYEPPTQGNAKVQPPLLKNGGSLAIGYGSGGWSARHFKLPEGQDVDVGFLKLFISSEYVDHTNLSQPSAFEKATRGTVGATPKTGPKWDTIMVTVVMRKSPPTL